jgi:hypothetical protein
MALNANISAEYGTGLYIPPAILFTNKFGCIPSYYNTTCYFNIKELLDYVSKKFPKMMEGSCRHYVRDKHGVPRLKSAMFFLSEGYAINIDVANGEIDLEFDEVYYDPGEDKKGVKAHEDHFKADVEVCFDGINATIKEAEKLMTNLLKFKVEPKRKSELNFLCTEGGQLVLKSLDLKSPELDITLNYGPKFKELHDYVFDRLVGKENKNKGLVLLYGDPGTGKTFYIRHLISLLSDKKRVIYVPPDMVQELSSPNFLPFLMEYPESILIIEDGENVIKSRKGGQNQAVSNLLNAADGLLSDALNVQILCTFNCKLSDVDDALLRKGRLIGKHEFKALSKEDAQALLKHLKINYTAQKEMTLADIYNCQDRAFLEERTTLGFSK